MFILILHQSISAQTRQIKFVKARTIEYDKDIAADAQRALGDVVFEHEGSYLYCDSAWFYTNRNAIDAFGSVHIKMSDTLNIYSEKLTYNGDNKTAELIDNVKLVDKQTVLTTNKLLYDRKTEIANYNEGGKIVDKENTLTSLKGYYFTRDKNFFFKDKVILNNPQYNIYSDTLLFNTETEIAYFFGPTDIISKENTIYCENGWYNTKSDLASFGRHSHMKNQNQYLEADSFYYDRVKDFGKAYRNVIIFDSTQNITFTGNYAEYNKYDKLSFITDSAAAIMVKNSDSLFLHADILTVEFDSLQTIRNMFAYNNSRFFSKDLQGCSDSLVYNASDTLITMYGLPILWADKNQLSADTILVLFRNKQVDQMKLFSSAFIISQGDSSQFDQLKGKFMHGFLNNNKLYKINVQGNAESLYFANEDNGNRIGINRAIAISMTIWLAENKIQSILFYDHPEATLFTPGELSQKEQRLKYFNWQMDKRPINKHDIYRIITTQ
ncbi:MAG: OstA-like protein [Bacteroidota bacterium]